MRRSLITLAAAVAAATFGLAPHAADAAQSVGTPTGPMSFTIGLCPTYYKSVTLTITDNGVLLNGGAEPACIRLWSSGALKIVNNASSEATVTFAGATFPMVIGELWNYAPIGAFFPAGSHLGFSVAELAGSSMTVQVF